MNRTAVDALCAAAVILLLAWFLSWGPAKLGRPATADSECGLSSRFCD